eukprot:3305051-Amphidinium_carterae.1
MLELSFFWSGVRTKFHRRVLTSHWPGSRQSPLDKYSLQDMKPLPSNKLLKNEHIKRETFIIYKMYKIPSTKQTGTRILYFGYALGGGADGGTARTQNMAYYMLEIQLLTYPLA